MMFVRRPALFLACSLLSTLLCGTSVIASPNLVKNGSFEDAGNGSFSGADGVSGWTMSGTAADSYFPVDIRYNQTSEYPKGAQGESVPPDNASSASPDGPGAYGVYFVSDQAKNLSIYQTVYLTPGSYQIGFDSYFTQNGFQQPGDAVFTANIAGVPLANIDLNGISPGVWTTHAGEADISVAGDYEVSFTFNTPDSPTNAKDIVIDQAYVVAAGSGGVSIPPVSSAPEPDAWLLMLAGVGLLGPMLRTMRRGAKDLRQVLAA